MTMIDNYLPSDSKSPTRTAAYFAAFIVLGAAGAVVGPTLPALAENVGREVSALGFLFALRSIARLASAFAAGGLYDRLTGHMVLGAMLILMAAALAIVPQAGVLWLLIAATIMHGISEGAVDVGGNTLMLWAHPDKPGPRITALHLTFGIGAFLSPLLASQFIRWSGTPLPTYGLIAGFALVPLVMLALAASPRYQAPTEETVSDEQSRWLLPLLVLLAGIYVALESAFSGWVFSYATLTNLATDATAATINSAYWGVLMVGRLLTIPLSSRFRPRYVLIAGWGLAAVSSVILLFSPTITGLWVAAVLFGAGMSPIFPMLFAYAERHTSMTGRATSWFLVSGGAGAMLLPWLVGVIGIPLLPLLLVVTFAIAAIVLGVLLVTQS